MASRKKPNSTEGGSVVDAAERAQAKRFSQWLNRHIAKGDLELTGVAQAAGISGPYLSMLRQGQRKPSYKTVVALSAALGAERELDAALAMVGLAPTQSHDGPADLRSKLVLDTLGLAARRPTKDLLCSLLNRLADAITFDYGSVCFVDSRQGGIHVLAHKIRDNEPLLGRPAFAPSQWPVSKGISGAAVTRGTIQRVDEVRESSTYLQHWIGTRSEIAVPLSREGAIVGVLNLESDEAAHFTERDERVLGSITDVFAAAVLRTRDNNRLEEVEQQLAGLISLHRTNLERRTEPDLLKDLAFNIVKSFKEFDLCTIRINDAEKGHLLLRGFNHRSSHLTFKQIGLKIKTRDSVTGRAIRMGHFASANPKNDPSFENRELAEMLGLRGMLVVPIPSLDTSDPALGTISVYTTSDDTQFHARYVELMTHVARFVTTALSALRKSLKLEAIVQTVNLCRGGVTRSSLDAVCRLICKETGARAASIFLLNGGNALTLAGTTGLRVLGTTGLQDIQSYSDARYAIGEGKTGWVALHNRSMRLINRPGLAELAAFEGAVDAFKCVENIQDTNYEEMGFVAAPISIGGKAVGVVRAALGRDDDLDFSPFDQELVEEIGRQIAAALEGTPRSDSLRLSEPAGKIGV